MSAYFANGKRHYRLRSVEYVYQDWLPGYNKLATVDWAKCSFECRYYVIGSLLFTVLIADQCHIS